jgi:threonine synthase
VRTLSNAMDVGNPSNFARMKDLYGSTWNIMKEDIVGYQYTDAATESAIRDTLSRYHYLIEPHGAVGLLSLNQYRRETQQEMRGIVLETAHPAKFLEDMERIISDKVEVPERLAILADKEKQAVQMNTDFAGFKKWLLEN